LFDANRADAGLTKAGRAKDDPGIPYQAELLADIEIREPEASGSDVAESGMREMGGVEAFATSEQAGSESRSSECQPSATIKNEFQPRISQAAEHLWLCIRFPELPLEVLQTETAAPQAVTVVQGNDVRILQANAEAEALGVRPGLGMNAALALAPELVLHERDTALERDALTALVEWAIGFTPVVSIVSGDTLLLEVKGSLSLFGGLSGLLSRMREELYEHEAWFASAPSAQAAVWMTAGGCQLHMDNLHDPRLKQLPVTVLDWSERLQKQFISMGIETLGDCLRLPRDGFVRRFGHERLEELDKGFGRMPDLRLHYAEPFVFEETLELQEETFDSGLLMQVVDQQLQALQSFMTERQLAAGHVCISFSHSRYGDYAADSVSDVSTPAPVTEIEIGLLEPQSAVHNIRQLIELRFERVQLKAPVQRVSLGAGTFADAAPVSAQLLESGHAEADSTAGARLVERLRARLGRGRVYGIVTADDYRPERAWQIAEPAQSQSQSQVRSHQKGRLTDATAGSERPLWLLRQPQPIAQPPVGHPERIEAGWWDGSGVQRDYYVVDHAAGRRAWVFRDRRGWYLHGLFG